jgi:hypothetical protein
MQVGCIIENDYVFAYDNVLLSATTIFLLTIAILFEGMNERIWFLFFELLFWLFKLFYIKGGYAVGIAGVPMLPVLFFDMIALYLRIILLNESLQFKFSNNYILIPLVVFFFLKLYYFG